MGGAGEPDRGAEVVDDPAPVDAEAGREGAHRACVRAGDDDPVDLLGAQLGRLQGRVPRLLAERHVLRLPEALLPDLRASLAGLTPAVDELLGGVALAEHGGEHRPVGSRPDQHGGAGVATTGLVGAGREPVAQVGGHDQGRVRAVQGRDHRRDPGADGATEIGGQHVAVEAHGGVDGGGVGLVEVRGTGRREPQGLRARLGCGPEREARRLDPHRGGVLVVAGHGASAPPAAGPEGLGDRGTVEPPVRHVAGDAQDPLHANGQRTRVSPDPTYDARVDDVRPHRCRGRR